MKRIPVIMIASLFVIGIPAIPISSATSEWMFGKTDGKGYTVSQWCMAHGRNQRKPEIARGIRNE